MDPVFLIGGILIFIIIALFTLFYKPVYLSTRGKYLQSVNPNKLDPSERWSKERSRNELSRERYRRKMMGRDIYR